MAKPANPAPHIRLAAGAKAYPLSHLTGKCNHTAAHTAILKLAERKQPTFSLVTFYKWRSGAPTRVSADMVAALAEEVGYTLVLVRTRDVVAE